MLSFRTAGFSGYGVQYSPFFDNKLAVATAANYGLVGNGKLFVLNITPQGEIREEISWMTNDSLFSTAWSELNENQIVTSLGDGSIKIFDTTVPNFPILQWKEHEREVFSVSWGLTDKTQLVSSSWDGTIKLWTPGRNQSLLTLNSAMNNDLTTKISSAVPLSNQPQHQGINTSHCVYSAKFSPHAPWQIISCSGAGKVQIWDIRDRKPLQMEYVAHGGFECLSVAPNFYKPEVIASAGSNGSIHLWDLRLISSTPHIRGPSPLNELLGHQFAVRNIKFSPHNANELVSASYDMSCRVWQDSSQERARFLNAGAATVGIFPQHKEFVMDCDYSLWGQPGWIASTGWDEMVYVWDSNRFRV